jgi:hypothetical protein
LRWVNSEGHRKSKTPRALAKLNWTTQIREKTIQRTKREEQQHEEVEIEGDQPADTEMTLSKTVITAV